MGKIYQFNGYVLFFYSNDHEPIHVHVVLGERKVKVVFTEFQGTISLEIKEISKTKFSGNQLEEIEDFCRTYSRKIIFKWNQQFTDGKKPRFEKIRASKKGGKGKEKRT